MSLPFVLGFVGFAVVLLVSLLIFTEASDVMITNNDDINCHVNYDHNLNCENQKIVYDGSEKLDYSFWFISMIPLGLVGFWIGRRIL